MLSRLSITAQFTIIGLLGIFLTVSALGISLDDSYHAGLEAKKTALKSIVDAGVSTTEGFVKLAEDGKMTTAQAQAAALAALSAARFDGGDYYFADKYDGTAIVHVNKALIGTDRAKAHDIYGHLTDAPMIQAAIAGRTFFNHYYIPKAGSTVPEPKISIMEGVPQWGWAIGSGLYVNDIWAAFMHRLYNLALIFVPFFLAVIVVVYLMRRSVSTLISQLTQSMERIAKGALQTEIPGLVRKDDVGRMAQAVLVFKNAAIEKQRLEQEVESARKAAEAEREKIAREREESNRQLEFVVGSLATGLQNLSSGELTYRLQETFVAEYEKLRGDFNAAMETLQQ
ncbi:MAG TPA: cache domain-containing protein, partial [Acidocella sp.]|nr:cache domain-containing protein [Acidocella sp.]